MLVESPLYMLADASDSRLENTFTACNTTYREIYVSTWSYGNHSTVCTDIPA